MLIEHEVKEVSSGDIIKQIFSNENWKDMVFLDTETTAIGGEALEISLVNFNGVVLFSERVNPIIKSIHPSAFKTHGISLEDVKRCPSFYSIFNDFYGWVKNRPPIIIYNSDFDVKILKTSLDNAKTALKKTQSVEQEEFFGFEFFCLMKLLSKYNVENGKSGKWLKLKDACAMFEIPTDENRLHGSAYDSYLASKLFMELAYRVGNHETRLKIDSLRG